MIVRGDAGVGRAGWAAGARARAQRLARGFRAGEALSVAMAAGYSEPDDLLGAGLGDLGSSAGAGSAFAPNADVLAMHRALMNEKVRSKRSKRSKSPVALLVRHRATRTT